MSDGRLTKRDTGWKVVPGSHPEQWERTIEFLAGTPHLDRMRRITQALGPDLQAEAQRAGKTVNAQGYQPPPPDDDTVPDMVVCWAIVAPRVLRP